jgi:TRAP-type mannitol/chloroaromatic compound transport system permease small subunit
MNALLALSKLIDAASEKLSHLGTICVLGAAFISAANAFVRYGFDISSNAWLEIQWYLFAVTVMLGAPQVLRLNEHVRVDLIYGKLNPKAAATLDLLGLFVFLFPVMGFMAWLSWPLFVKMFLSGELSPNAGGLIRWPAMLLLPLGFTWMCLQGVSEVIKRVAFLAGHTELDLHYEKPMQ